jgi:hypothetical protein
MAEQTTAVPSRPDKERRRSPRFNCGGYVEINWLPSNGIYVPGQVRDLSLNGCCIDTKTPIDAGMRAEIFVRVKANSFRAVGEVRVIRDGSGAGIEFVRLSAGGKELLEDLVGELAKLQAAIDKLKSDGDVLDPESFRKEMDYRKLQAEMLSTRFPFLATLVPGGAEESETPVQSTSGEKILLVERRPLVISLDLFG